MGEHSTIIVRLSQKPCVVSYLEKLDKFLVGTYQLSPSKTDAGFQGNDEEFEEKLKNLNQRAGKLILVDHTKRSPEIVYEYHCSIGGGVFDFKPVEVGSSNVYNIYAAHTNGIIGIYELVHGRETTICLKSNVKVASSSILVTSIDVFGLLNGETRAQMIVGDSSGHLTWCSEAAEITRKQVAEFDPAWNVKSLDISCGRRFAIVGAENCTWSVYALRSAERIELIYRNEGDFSAGVTCITVLDVTKCDTHDNVRILLGSYDSWMIIYQIKLFHSDEMEPEVSLESKISIDENAGIWRAKMDRNRSRLLVAAMYAGCHSVGLDLGGWKFSAANCDCSEKTKRLLDLGKLITDFEPLLYDIDVSGCGSVYCAVDFNNSSCLILRHALGSSTNKRS